MEINLSMMACMKSCHSRRQIGLVWLSCASSISWHRPECLMRLEDSRLHLDLYQLQLHCLLLKLHRYCSGRGLRRSQLK